MKPGSQNQASLQRRYVPGDREASRFLSSLTVACLCTIFLFPEIAHPGEFPFPSRERATAPAAPRRKPALQARGLSFSLGNGILRLGVELRTRSEVWHGYTVKGPLHGADDHALLLRTRLLAEYRHARGHRFLVELQDSRYWWSRLGLDDFPRTCPFANHLDIRRAFVESPLLDGGAVSVKLGRQTITYADKRVFGPGNWGNVGRYWWDAVKITARLGSVRTDLLWGQRVVREPTRLDTDHYPFHMLGLYTIVPVTAGELHLFLLERREHRPASGVAGAGPTRIHTGGVYFRSALGRHWTAEGTLAVQRGTRGGDTVRAWGGNLRVRRRLHGRWWPYCGAEISIGSGDRNPHDGVAGTFDGLFGSISGAYGRMNLFSWRNLRDYQLTAGITPQEGLHLWVDLHRFELDSPRDAWYWCSGKPVLRDPEGHHGRELGHELDLLVRKRFDAHWELFAGGGVFRAGSFPAQDPSLPRHMAWGFVQLLYRF